MGDRGVVRLVLSGVGKFSPQVELYTHWGGRAVPLAVQRALRGASSDEELLQSLCVEMIRDLGDHSTDPIQVSQSLQEVTIEQLDDDDGVSIPPESRTSVRIARRAAGPDWPTLVIERRGAGWVLWLEEARKARGETWTSEAYKQLDFSRVDLEGIGGWSVLTAEVEG